MELRVLRYFLATAREESITKAAEVLHITQPTLSRQLIDLEEQLGKQLIVRGNRKLTLTDEGRILRKRAEEIIDLMEKAEMEITTSNEIISGDVCIGGGETEGMRLIAKTAKELQKKYPHIKYNLFSGNADDVTEKLDKGLLDFGILIEPVDLKKYDYIKLPLKDTWGVLMRKDGSLASRNTIKPVDLLDVPIIFSKQTLVRNKISGWLGRDFEKLNVICSYNLIYNASLMVEEGVGYALCLDKLVNTTGNHKICFKPLEPRLEVGIYIVWKKYQMLSKAAEKFISQLQNEISNLNN